MNDTYESAMTTGTPKPAIVVRICDAVIRWSILALVALMPLFFLPWTIEVLELNKQLLLVVAAALMGLAWVGKMLAERKFEYRRSVVNIIVVLFVAVYAISSIVSENRYASLVGDFGQEKAGLVTVGALAILYFVIINNVRTVRSLNRVMFATVLGGLVAVIFGVLQGLGAFIMPFAFAKTTSFNTIGTASSLAIYGVFIATLASGMLIATHNANAPTKKSLGVLLYKVMLGLAGGLSILLVAIVDYWPVTLCLVVSSALLVGFAFVHAKSLKGISGIMMPIFAIVIGLMLMVFKLPLSVNFPAEVMPSMKASNSIAIETLRERPFFGSGPGTFMMDYAKYRTQEVNQTYFWNVRFDRGASRIITMTATNGLLGTLSWLLLALLLIGSSIRRLFSSDEETWHMTVGVFAAFTALFIAKFVYSSSLSLEFATWLAMALLVVVQRREFFSIKFENSPRAAMMLSFIFILGLVFSLSGLVVEGQRYAAEVHYAKAIAIDQAGGNVDDVIKHLSSATNLNKPNDVYLRNLSLAALAKANTEAGIAVKLDKNEGESDDDYKGRVEQAKQDKIRLVAQLSADAVNIAKRATEVGYNNVANWAVLAQVYGGLFGVTQGADEWSAKAWERAIELEPNHPAHHTELGKIFLYQANQTAQGVDEKDEKAKEEAKKKSDELLGKAADHFNKAIELKGDYAAAHYNLSMVLDAQGKIKDAIKRMEGVVSLSPSDVGVGFQLAILYFRDERKTDAVGLLEQVVRLKPDFANARWYLAAMYEEAGNLDKAIEQIEKVAELNKDDNNVKQRLEQLQAKKAAPVEPAPVDGELPAPVDQPTENAGQPSVQKR